MGCLLAPLKGIWTFLKWSFTNGWKGIVVLGLVLLLVWVGVCQCQSRVSPTVKGEDKEPGIAEAPYLVQTISRYFYATRVGKWGSRVTLIRYWEFIGGKWRYSDRLVLDKKEVGEIVVSKR